MTIDGYVIPEKEIQNTSMAILRAHGCYVWRNNTGMHRGEHKGKKWAVRYGLVGSCDILGVLPDGRFLGCEVKRAGEKPTEAQLTFILNVNACNGAAFWSDNVGQVEMVVGYLVKGYRIDSDLDGNRLEPRGTR